MKTAVSKSDSRATAAGALDRPSGAVVALLIGASVVASSWMLFSEELSTYRLSGDDFIYLADSRDAKALVQNLFKPHNAHVAPLFRIWVYLLATSAGGLDKIASVFGAGAFLSLVLLMLTVGHFVSRETKSLTLGLASLALIGLSSVIEPAVAWFCASQTLWAAVLVVVALESLRNYRRTEKLPWLFVSLAFAFLAPFFWSGGYSAGLVCAVYLWTDGRKAMRRAAAAPLAATAVAGILALIIALGYTKTTQVSPLGSLIQFRTGVGHSSRAFVEGLVLGNLGLDASSSLSQGVILSALAALLWIGSMGWKMRPSPLEAAGLVLIASTLGMAFTFRAGEPYEILRNLGWYLAMPQVGFVLFLAGLASRKSSAPAPYRIGMLFC